MKILTGYYLNPITKRQISENRSRSLQLKHDTVCFRGKDLLELTKDDVIKRVKESVRPENFLGQGTEAEVYKINDSNYCVRLPHFIDNLYESFYSKEVSPVDKVNHVKAKLGFGASIMEFFDGVIPKWYRDNKYNRYQLQSDIAGMPIKSYSELLHQIADALDNELFFDYSGGNLVVDIKSNKLTAIDFYGVCDNPRQAKPLTEMYSVLTCYGSKEETGKNIFDKIVTAGLEEFKPNKIPCMDISLFDFESLCLKRCRDNFTKNHNSVVQDIAIQERILKKLKKAEIIDKSLHELLEQNIMKFKQLISKVR